MLRPGVTGRLNSDATLPKKFSPRMNKRVRNTIAVGVGYVIIKWAIIIGIGGELFKSGYWNNWYLLAIPTIGLTSFFC
jgi:hypothetical protein